MYVRITRPFISTYRDLHQLSRILEHDRSSNGCSGTSQPTFQTNVTYYLVPGVAATIEVAYDNLLQRWRHTRLWSQ